jgi:hypothetical protein
LTIVLSSRIANVPRHSTIREIQGRLACCIVVPFS